MGCKRPSSRPAFLSSHLSRSRLGEGALRSFGRSKDLSFGRRSFRESGQLSLGASFLSGRPLSFLVCCPLGISGRSGNLCGVVAGGMFRPEADRFRTGIAGRLIPRSVGLTDGGFLGWYCPGASSRCTGRFGLPSWGRIARTGLFGRPWGPCRSEPN